MTEKMGITNLGSAWRVRAFYQSVCGDLAKKGNPRVPQPDARWLAAQLPGSVALSLLQGRLGMSITDTIPSANMARPSFGRTPFSLAAAVELRDGQLHPTIAGTIMAKTPTAKTQTAKKPISKKSPAKAVAKAPVKKATSVATKPAKAPAKKSTSVAKKPTLKPAAKSALPKKQTADRTSSIAGTVLKTAKATVKQVKTLAGSVLGQDETKGKRKK